MSARERRPRRTRGALESLGAVVLGFESIVVSSAARGLRPQGAAVGDRAVGASSAAPSWPSPWVATSGLLRHRWGRHRRVGPAGDPGPRWHPGAGSRRRRSHFRWHVGVCDDQGSGPRSCQRAEGRGPRPLERRMTHGHRRDPRPGQARWRARGLTGAILARIEAKGYASSTIRLVEPDRETPRAATTPSTRASRSTSRCWSFMLSGPSGRSPLAGNRVIEGFRSLAGTTDPTTAAPGTIRGDFGRDWGLKVQQNLVHWQRQPSPPRANSRSGSPDPGCHDGRRPLGRRRSVGRWWRWLRDLRPLSGIRANRTEIVQTAEGVRAGRGGAAVTHGAATRSQRSAPAPRATGHDGLTSADSPTSGDDVRAGRERPVAAARGRRRPRSRRRT